MTGDDVTAAEVATAIGAYRAEQHRRYGHALVEVDGDVDAAARRVTLRGRMLAARLGSRLAAYVGTALGPAWTVDATQVQGVTPRGWSAADASVTRLLAAIPGEGRSARLATELRDGDGPVRLVCTHATWSLVVADDATMGWTDQVLAPAPAPPPRTWVDVDGTGFVAAARRHLGTRYRLGGTTADGIDCSGLVQRALRDSARGLVPRHTRDQLAIGSAEGPGEDVAGTWIFVWSSTEAPGHVGIATGDGRVVHASRHRGVIEDTRREFLAESGRVRHVAWTTVCALQARLAGHRTLDEVFALGQRG